MKKKALKTGILLLAVVPAAAAMLAGLGFMAAGLPVWSAAVVLALIVAAGAYAALCVCEAQRKPYRRLLRFFAQIRGSADLKQDAPQLLGASFELREIAAQAGQMLARLQSSFDGQDKLVRNAIGELRAPISLIASQCDRALYEAQTAQEAAQALEIILTQATALSQLMSRLEVISRMDRGDKARRQIVSLSDIARSVAFSVSETAQRAGIRVRTDIEPEVRVRGDEALLRQLLVNLLQHGIRYGRDGGYVALSLRAKACRVYVSVQDDGAGISSEDLPRIWDRLYVSSPDRTEDGMSTGLNYAAAKWIVEAHGGVLSVRSELGQGSVFEFEIDQAATV